jgi:ribosome biogenesis GTPase
MGKWDRYQDDDLDNFEKIKKIRRKRNLHRSEAPTVPFERDESDWDDVQESDKYAARVVEVHKRYAFISPEPNLLQIETRDVQLATVARKYLATSRGERNFICVGDRVLCRPANENEKDQTSELPQAVILHVAPRKTKIARLDPSQESREHILASNMEQLVFVASYAKPSVKWGLIDRYLVLAEIQELPVIIVLNKADLLDEMDTDELKDTQEKEAYYRSLGYELIGIQANRKSPLKDPQIVKLRECLQNRLSLVSGHSGVGKSSIVNLFKPEIEQDIEPDDDIFYKGRHTTSYASLIKLGIGGYIIDTPGIRSFCFEEKSAIQLTYCFREFRDLVGKCKFRECRHVDEPNCLVREQVKAGVVPEWRYKSFLSIFSGSSGREGRIRDISL